MKETFDKIVLNEDRKEQMRENILAKQPAKKTWLAPVIAVAATAAIVMIVPFTRTAVVNAAEQLWKAITTSHNGLSITVSETEVKNTGDEIVTAFDYEFSTNNFEDFAQEKNGRLFMVLDGKWTDVTDKCSMDKYYRQEIKEKDGTKTVIIIGGTPEDHGWCIFTGKGEFLDFMYNAKGKPEWLKKALTDEGHSDAIEQLGKTDGFTIIGSLKSGDTGDVSVDMDEIDRFGISYNPEDN